MNNFSRKSEEEKFTFPWAEKRGRETLRCSADLTLVRTPLDFLSNTLAESAIEVQRGVLNTEIEISGFFKFAYQLIGHPWSIVIPDGVIESNRTPAFLPPNPLQISEVLQQPVIQLNSSNVTDTVAYALFENGELIEYFAGEPGEVPKGTNPYEVETQRYIVSPYQESPEYTQTVSFWSNRRQFPEGQFSDIWNFTEQFLVENDAFDPTIDSRYLLSGSRLRRGRRYHVGNPGFILVTQDQAGNQQEIASVPNFFRVDYFRFGY